MSKSVAAFQTAKDPVCGMSVSPDSAVGSFEYNGQTYYCIVGVADPFKESTPEAIRQLHEQNIRIVMVTGDSRTTGRGRVTKTEYR